MIKGSKKIINAWVLYDWANSVYPLVITTAIFPIYYESITSTDESDIVSLFGREYVNTALYSYTIALSYLIIAFLSPILSGIADYSGKKKSFMQFFCYLGAISCITLYTFSLDYFALGLLFVMLASIGYSGSIVFYNAFLPEIAEPEQHDTISAKGYAFGYFGSSLLLIFNLSMVMFPEFYGLEDGSMPAKISFLTVGLWWIVFSQITFKRLPDNIHGRKPDKDVILKGFRELKKVWNELKGQVRLKRYLLSFFIFNMGVQTIMLMATIFGSKELGVPTEGLIAAILIIQFVAIIGAYLFSFLSRKLGNINGLAIAILIWIGVCAGAYFVYEPSGFYVLAGFAGLVMGGIQSLSRSTYSKMLPKTIDPASYFSFYDVCEKIGIVIGMLTYGYIEEVTGSMRNSIFALMGFFILGLIVLMTIPKKRGTADQ